MWTAVKRRSKTSNNTIGVKDKHLSVTDQVLVEVRGVIAFSWQGEFREERLGTGF